MGNAGMENKRKRGLFGFGEPRLSKLIPLFLLALFCVSFATDAIAAYRSNTGASLASSPKIRYWNSTNSSWGPEVELPSAGSPIRYLQIKISPIADKMIIVTQSDDGYIDAYVCAANCGSAGSWALSNNIGQVWATAPGTSSKRFDVDFESAAGDAMVAYSVVNANAANDIAYKVLPQASTIFSGVTEQYINDAGHATDIQYTWIHIDPNPRGDEMILAGFDGTNTDINAWVWSGTAWGNYIIISPNPSSTSGYDALGAKYTSDGAQGMVVGAQGANGDLDWAYWNSTAWSAISSFDVDASSNADVRWVTIKADPSSRGIQAVSITSTSSLETEYWNGSAWAMTGNVDALIDSGTSRAADFEWNPTGSTGRLVWDTDTTGTTLSQRACSPQCTGATSTISTYAGTGAWLSMRVNPTSTDTVKILGLRLNSAFNTGSFWFNGSTFTNYGDSALSADTVVSTYESYDLAFYRGDLIPPFIGAISIIPSHVSGSTFVSGISNISANVSDSKSGVSPSSCEYTINNGSTWVAATYSGGACIANGANTSLASSINFRARDNAGNLGNGTPVIVVPDILAPATSASAITNSSSNYTFSIWTNSSYVNVTFACSDVNGSGCNRTAYCTDALNNCTPSTIYAGSVMIGTQGVSYIRYSSLDNVGNAEPVRNQTIQIDATAPITSASAITNNSANYTFNTWTNSPYVNVTLICTNGTGSGCSATLYCLDTANNCTPSTVYSSAVQISTSGISYIRYLSNNTAGNMEEIRNQTILIDTVAPATNASAVNNDSSAYTFNTMTASLYVNVTLSCSDADSGCNRTLYCNDSSDTCVPSILYSGPVKMSGNGTMHIRYYSVDQANNSEAINSRAIIIVPGNTVLSCNMTLPQNSINYLSGDLFAGNSSCLTIDKQNVTLDCENHSIIGGGTGFDNGAGILVIGNLATIRNCRIEMFVSGIGVYYSNYNSISNVYAFNNTMGILLQGASQNTLSNINAFQNNLGVYLQYSSWNNLTNINVQNNTYGIYEYADSANNAQSNTTSINNTY